MNQETKTIRAALKQAGEAGEFEAVIATFGELDRDGDIVEPGAFGDQSAPIAPAHDSMSVALGKVFRIEERGTEAVAVGKFNLDIEPGREWHKALKFDLDHPPSLQEWSWGYFPSKTRFEERDGDQVRILEKIDLIEVSPVQRGASIGTRTVTAKSLSVHKTETSDAPFDLVANMRRLKSPPEFLLHHFIGEDGEEGPASIRACLTGIAALNIGADDPAATREKAYAHLAAHLKDAGIEPPELRDADSPPSLRLVDQVKFARWGVESALERLRNLSAERLKQGRKVGNGTKGEVALLAAECTSLAKTLEAVTAAMQTCGPDDAVSRAITEFALSQARPLLTPRP